MIQRILSVTLLAYSLARADSPPSWQPFAVESANHQFSAHIVVADRQGKEHPSQWRYVLEVFNRSSSSMPLWKSDYAFDGYSDHYTLFF
jgi:hypothetical protein